MSNTTKKPRSPAGHRTASSARQTVQKLQRLDQNRAKDAEVAVSLLKKQYHNDFGVTPWLTISKHEKDEKTTKPEVACVSRTVETPETTEARSNPDCGYDEKSRGFTEALQLC
jgi:hypothetical protein